MLHDGVDNDDQQQQQQQQRMQLEAYCHKCVGGGGNDDTAAAMAGISSNNNNSSSSVNKLLMDCARAMDHRQWHQAAALLAQLVHSRASSPTGDSSERLAYYLARGLARNLPSPSLLLLRQDMVEGVNVNVNVVRELTSSSSSSSSSSESSIVSSTGAAARPSMEERASAYLALNQVTPFVRFAHLSANQAILEAVEGKPAVHIVDLGMVHGLQWPPLMQALVERRRQQQQQQQDDDGSSSSSSSSLPGRLRITGTGTSVVELEQTGWRLRDFASSLGLAFHFDALPVSRRNLLMPPPADRLRLCDEDDEALVINSMVLLHQYAAGGLQQAAASIASLSPTLVTVAEAEAWRSRRASSRHLVLEPATAAAAQHYSPLFDSLEATLPPRSEQRLLIERVLLGAELSDWLFCRPAGDICVDDNDAGKQQICMDHGGWREAMEAVGFQGTNPSGFAIAQAKLLLRLHYPSEGYKLLVPGEDHPFNGSLFISWRGAPLFSVSAWQAAG